MLWCKFRLAYSPATNVGHISFFFLLQLHERSCHSGGNLGNLIWSIPNAPMPFNMQLQVGRYTGVESLAPYFVVPPSPSLSIPRQVQCLIDPTYAPPCHMVKLNPSNLRILHNFDGVGEGGLVDWIIESRIQTDPHPTPKWLSKTMGTKVFAMLVK